MASYSAVGLHPSLGSNTPGELRAGPASLVFSYEGGAVDLPFSGLQITRGGASNALIFFAHEARPDWSIYTRDKSILVELEAVSELAGTLASIADTDRRRRNEWLVFAVAVCALVWVGWKLKDPLVDVLTYFVPKSWESSAGDLLYASVSASMNIINDDDLTKRLEHLVEPLTAVVKDSGYTFRFHLAKDDDLNAFALPGGHVIVNSGVILKSDRAEEVLGVLAHELAHVTERHSVRQIFSVLGIYFIFDIIFGNVAGSAAALTQMAPYLLEQGFSRSNEEDADNKGFTYMVEAGIDPRGMVEFFTRVFKEVQEVPAAATVEKHLAFLSTHPGTEERIASLEAKAREVSSGKYRDVGAGFKEFQERLRDKLGENDSGG